jgi:hypothetical protein
VLCGAGDVEGCNICVLYIQVAALIKVRGMGPWVTGEGILEFGSSTWLFSTYTFKWLAYRTYGSHLWVRGCYRASREWGVDPETYCTAVQVVHYGNIRSSMKGANIRIGLLEIVQMYSV